MEGDRFVEDDASEMSLREDEMVEGIQTFVEDAAKEEVEIVAKVAEHKEKREEKRRRRKERKKRSKNGKEKTKDKHHNDPKSPKKKKKEDGNRADDVDLYMHNRNTGHQSKKRADSELRILSRVHVSDATSGRASRASERRRRGLSRLCRSPRHRSPPRTTA